LLFLVGRHRSTSQLESRARLRERRPSQWCGR
jgi:hypothetical protein